MSEDKKPASGGDFGAGWWGEEQAKKGVSVPGPYGQPPEVSPTAPDIDNPAEPDK